MSGVAARAESTWDPSSDPIDMANVRVRPFGDGYLCRYIAPETQTAGGIIIADSYRQATGEAIVLACGTGYTNERGVLMMPDVTLVGKRVMLGKYVGSMIEVDGVEYVVIDQKEILAILE